MTARTKHESCQENGLPQLLAKCRHTSVWPGSLGAFYAGSNMQVEVIAGTVPQTWSIRVSYVLSTTQACPLCFSSLSCAQTFSKLGSKISGYKNARIIQSFLHHHLWITKVLNDRDVFFVSTKSAQ